MTIGRRRRGYLPAALRNIPPWRPAFPIVIRYNSLAVAERTKRELDFSVLANFRYEIRRYLNFSERAARARGVEPHQHQALLALKGLPHGTKATVGVLAERLQIQHHSAVELADRLVRHGLVLRSRSVKDRREVLLHLTRDGETIVWELSLPHRAELRAAGQRLLRALEAALGEAEGSRTLPAASGRRNKPQGGRRKSTTSSQRAKRKTFQPGRNRR